MKLRKNWQNSQVRVEHPEEHLALIKEALQEKEGIPVDQQRLIFGTEAEHVLDQEETTKQQPAAEEILSSLSQWQAIIFQDGKVIGRSLTLRLYSCEAVDRDLCSQGLGVESFALQLDSWLPSWKPKSDDSSPLYIAVDERFQTSRFHIQLLGRTSEGKNFALPFAYRFDGAHAQARLEYFDSYVRRHQRSRQEKLDTAVTSELCVHFDEGLQGFTAVFDVVDQPHWLKCFVLRFSVLIASKLDDNIVPRSNSDSRTAEKKADNMAPTKQSADSGTHRIHPQQHPEQQIAAGPTAGPASLSQASALGWLPPALLPPKADTRGKQKQSKKLMKQRASTAGGGRERDAAAAALPRPSAGSNGWDTTFSDIPGADSRIRAAMSDVGVGVPTAKSVRTSGPHSADSLHADDSPPPMANGHPGKLSRAASKDSEAGAGSMVHDGVGIRTSSQEPPQIPDTALQWSSMHGADGIVRASLANGHGSAKGHSRQNGCHMPLHSANGDVSKQALQEPSMAGTNGFRVDRHALNGTPNDWQSAQDTASTRSLDLALGEDSDVTMRYSSLESDRSEGTDVSPELPSPPMCARQEPLAPIRLTVPGVTSAPKQREAPSSSALGTDSQHTRGPSEPQPTMGAEQGHSSNTTAGQGKGKGSCLESHPMREMSSAATSTADSSSGSKPSPLVSHDRASNVASNVEEWMGASAQHLASHAVRLPEDAPLGREHEPWPLHRPSAASGNPPPSQSPAAMASTIQPGGPLLPVEAPPAAYPVPVTQQDPAPAALSQAPGQPAESSRKLPAGPGGRRHSWSADDFPGHKHHGKQIPASPFAGEELRGRPWPAQSSGHGVAQRSDPPSAMRPPVSASSMGYAAVPPAASSMQGPWQMQPVQLLSANSDFVRELQHRMHLQLQQQHHHQQQQQQRGFLHQTAEHRGPVRTRSLPKMPEQHGQWMQNGRAAAGAEQWPLPASHPLGQPHSQGFAGAPHERQTAHSSGKQATVQHIEALSHLTAGGSRSRQEQAPPPVRGLHRMGFSLPTTPVGGHQGVPFPSSAAAVRVQLSEGPAVWMGAADAMQLALAQQHHSTKPPDALHMPAADPRKHRESGEAAQPPPPPPRSGVTIMQRQGSTQVPIPPPASLWGHQGPPLTDIERFLSLAAPILGSRNHADLKLSDVWSFYDEASIYGKEVFTMGGGRGPSLAYYVPSLSAMQLFVPMRPEAAHTQPAGQIYRLSDATAAKHPKWPRLMTPLAELFESTKPYDRPALRERVEMLAESSSAGGVPGSRVMDQPLSELHPASWMCVAWYPIYRIPDAPLTAKFLTYHTFSPVTTVATHYGARSLAAGQPAQHSDGPLCLPTVGLKLCHLASEEWLDPVPSASLSAAGIGRTNSSSSSSADTWSVTTDEEGGRPVERERTAVKSAAGGGWEGPYARRAQLRHLSESADALSMRDGLVAQFGAVKGRHDDYTFFISRCEDDYFRLYKPEA